MAKRETYWGQIRRVVRLAAPPTWAGPLIITLGLSAAGVEAFGLSLFIPLLHSLGAGSPASSSLERALTFLLAPIPQDYLTVALVSALCITVVVKNAINLLNSLSTRYVDGIVAHKLRIKAFVQTMSSCVDYASSNRRSDINTTVSTNTWQVSAALNLVYRSTVCVCTCVVFLSLMMVISVTLTLVSITFIAVSALVVQRATAKAGRTGRAVVAENKRFGLRMWESLNALQLIRAFCREGYEYKRLVAASDKVRREMLKLELLWALPGPMVEISITLLIGILIVTAQNSGIGIAQLAAFLSLLYKLQGPTRELMQSKVALNGYDGAISDVESYLISTSSAFLEDGPRDAPPLRTALALHAVSFRYGASEPWALRNVSIEIPAGKTTAIIGRSGAGKSTLMSLLLRFQDPTEGSVTADMMSLKEFNLSSWRRQIGLMPQEVQLFNATIAENIAYGDLEAGLEQIREAARVAHADEFIRELPDGYETLVGERGARLSGGQRQRIALARTILRQPNVLLLDEATNALDVEAEFAFQQALETFSRNRTTVIIAHRLSTVERADQIIVMDQGKIIEIGSPRELLINKGHFARLYNLQIAGPVVASGAV